MTDGEAKMAAKTRGAPRARSSTTALRQSSQRAHGPDARAGKQRTPTGRRAPRADTVLDCGWGRLIFGHTFGSNRRIAEALADEAPGRRDIAFYLSDPHVVISAAPQDLFLDPSHSYRLRLHRYRPPRNRPRGFVLRRFRAETDIEAINRIYMARGMVPLDPGFLLGQRHARRFTFMVAEDRTTGAVIGVVTGIDHRHAFDDPEDGSSLWCLAVDPQASHPGIGEALTRSLAEHYLARGRAYLDLSVMHDNAQAIALYEKLGFERLAVFCVKRKNPINEKLFIGPAPEARLNPYALVIVDEARRRGIGVEVADEDAGYFTLSNGGRAITCRESLSDLTTAVAMSRCDDKAVTTRLLRKAGLSLPAQIDAGTPADNAAFLAAQGRVVVKPARGEQGAGVSVDLSTAAEMEAAVERARRLCDKVLIEKFVAGEDLRLIVIGFELVAAAVRRPARIVGDGRRTAAELIEAQSRRRAAATGGESRIPVDDETRRCLASAGHDLDAVLPEGDSVAVRRAANLHTGGTIHDVTDELHPALAAAAVGAARVLDIPVVGLDFMVPRVDGPDYVVIEANERPGLANHEPQPTAERFVDLLFPETAGRRSAA